MTDTPVRGLEEHVSFDTLRSIVGDALHATAYGSGHRTVWPARYAAHVDLLLRILAQKDATIAGLREGIRRLGSMEAFKYMGVVPSTRLGDEFMARIDFARALLAPAPREGGET